MRDSWEEHSFRLDAGYICACYGDSRDSSRSTDVSISKLFPPQDFEDNTQLILTIDGSEYSVTIPYETLKALKAGYLSTIFLEVKGTGDISGVKVYPWDTSVVPGGDNDATLD